MAMAIFLAGVFAGLISGSFVWFINTNRRQKSREEYLAKIGALKGERNTLKGKIMKLEEMLQQSLDETRERIAENHEISAELSQQREKNVILRQELNEQIRHSQKKRQPLSV